MRSLPLVLLFLSTFSSLLAKTHGLGFMVGEPSAFSYKQMITSDSAFDVGVGFSILDHGGFSLHADYVLHFDAFKSPDWILYLGGGLVIQERRFNSSDKDDKTNKEIGLGPRFMGGAEYYLPKTDISLFAEGAMHLFLAPDLKLRSGLAIGARYWF